MAVTIVVAGALAMSVAAALLRPALARRHASRNSRSVPAAPDTLYRWLAEVRRAAQDEHGLPFLEFEQPIGNESQRFLLAWSETKLQLLISNNRCRYRFASSEHPIQTRFDIAPPATENFETGRTDDRFWQLESDGQAWTAVATPEQHAQGLMLAKLFFASWQNHAGRLTGS